MLIKFHFDDETIDLPIELVANPAIDSWKQHFLDRDQSVVVDGFFWDPMGKKIYHPDEVRSQTQQCLEILEESVARLKNLQVEFPYEVPDVDSVDQDWANRAHRWFTHTQKDFNEKRVPGMSFQNMKAYRSQVTEQLQIVNEYIHAVENYIPAPNVGFERGTMWEIYLSDEPPCTHPRWWQMNPEWRSYHSPEHYDVIFGSQILGKTILKSFLDQDDPRDWDTSGHYNNNGALQILPTRHRQQVYQSQQFRDWVERHDISLDQVWYDFPVGNVLDHSALEKITKKFQTQAFLKVSYHKR
jgi:hypothetical protein